MLLLSTEFTIHSVLRLWDSLLGDPERFNFFDYVCVAKIILQRKEVLDHDFPEIIKDLQKPSMEMSMKSLLSKAVEIIVKDQGNDEYSGEMY